MIIREVWDAHERTELQQLKRDRWLTPLSLLALPGMFLLLGFWAIWEIGKELFAIRKSA